MRPIPGAFLAFLAGLIVVYILVVAIGHALLQGASDPGGRWAIRVMFQIGPLCALVGGIVAAIIVGRRLARNAHAVAAEGAPTTRSPPSKRWVAVVALVAASLLAYLLARVLFGLP